MAGYGPTMGAVLGGPDLGAISGPIRPFPRIWRRDFAAGALVPALPSPGTFALWGAPRGAPLAHENTPTAEFLRGELRIAHLAG